MNLQLFQGEQVSSSPVFAGWCHLQCWSVPMPLRTADCCKIKIRIFEDFLSAQSCLGVKPGVLSCRHTAGLEAANKNREDSRVDEGICNWVASELRWVRRPHIRMRWVRRRDMINLVLEMSRRQYLLEGCDHLTAVSWRPEQSKVSYRSTSGSSCEE